jgi:hypothetical protein
MNRHRAAKLRAHNENLFGFCFRKKSLAVAFFQKPIHHDALLQVIRATLMTPQNRSEIKLVISGFFYSLFPLLRKRA